MNVTLVRSYVIFRRSKSEIDRKALAALTELATDGDLE
jgi:hypothetical protein